MTPAERLVSAESALLRSECEVEALLDALYDKWQDWEHGPGPTIDVYGVTPQPAAANALRLAGFRFAFEHEHASNEFMRCACRCRP